MVQIIPRMKNSLATQLLTVIFGLYFIVTVIVTIVQLTAEYYNEKDGVTQEIQMLPETFGEGLQGSLWTFNYELLHTILIGINKLSIVSGSKVTDDQGEMIDSFGIFIDQQGNNISVDEEGKQLTLTKAAKQLIELFEYTFPITYLDENNEIHNLGNWTVYTSQMVILDRVKYGFFLILINSVIKTLALWFIFYLIIRRVLGVPLEKLKRDIEKVEMENLETSTISIKSKRNNELKILEKAFNSMIKNLLKSRQHIDHLNQNLEKKVEERTSELTAILKEKETLLQEIHHRVKNNMTVISSLLYLQMTSITDEKAKEALQDSQNRVQTMSMIHETLYRSDNLSSIDMQVYLSELGRNILQGYTIRNNVTLKIETENILISVKQASPLGLIVNELITNSLKYAFPNDRKGEIVLKLKSNKENEAELTVSDNGIGIPEEFDLQNADSLGLKLVKIIAEDQLDGSIDMESKNGTKFTIKFNLEN